MLGKLRQTAFKQCIAPASSWAERIIKPVCDVCGAAKLQHEDETWCTGHGRLRAATLHVRLTETCKRLFKFKRRKNTVR